MPLPPNYYTHFFYVFALEITFEYCICMVEILYNGVLPCISFLLCIQRHVLVPENHSWWEYLHQGNQQPLPFIVLLISQLTKMKEIVLIRQKYFIIFIYIVTNTLIWRNIPLVFQNYYLTQQKKLLISSANEFWHIS